MTIANTLYDNIKNQMLGAGTHARFDWNSDDIRCSLTREAVYTPNFATDIDYADVPGIIGTTVSLTSPTVGIIAAGVADAVDTTFTSVGAGADVQGYVFYDYASGVAATAPLIAYFGTAAAGLPVTPNGGDITIAHNAGGIIAL